MEDTCKLVITEGDPAVIEIEWGSADLVEETHLALCTLHALNSHFSKDALRVAVKCFVEECRSGDALLAEALDILSDG